MEAMEEMFGSGRIVDLILGLIVLETAALMAYHKFTGGGIATTPLLTNMAAGSCLLLALRAALTGTHWRLIAVALGAAFAMHLLDLRSRWSRG
jgi:hypothetical protein